jgi:putative ABC transport system permease protein
MFSLTLKSIRAGKARFLLTGVAVLLGVAFMAGTFVLTDTIKRSYDRISADALEGTDAVVRSSRVTGVADQAVETRGTISAAVLDAVRRVPGVQAAEAEQRGIAVVTGHDGRLLDTNPNRSVPLALAWQGAPELNPMELVSGRGPRAPDEIVVDRASARDGGFAVGERVDVVSPAGTEPFRIAGIATYGGADDAAGSQVVAFTPETAARVIGTPGRYDAIHVAAAPGVDERTLVASLRSAITEPATEVLTGTAATAEAAADTSASLGFVNMFLMTFAVVALVVGSFVIYNTFSITVAQRTRETAMLRAIGANRRQILRSVRFEALLVGLVASTLGVVAGIGLAQGLRALLSGFGVELPSGGAVIEPRTIVISVATGTVVALVAAWWPARKAAEVAPIEALRSAAIDGAGRSRSRLVLGTLVALGGAAGMGNGLSGGGVGAVGMGAFGVFLGVAMLGPVIAARFARVVGSPLPRMRGVAGSLARENAMRNPKRTAATSSALMIGIALVAFITVFAASAKASMADSVDSAMRSELIVTSQFGMGGLSPTVAEEIDALPETGAVSALRYFDAQVGDSTTAASAVDPSRVEQGVAFDLRAGSISGMGPGDIAVRADVADEERLAVGDEVTMTFAETGDQRFTVAAVYRTNEPLGDYVITTQAFDANMATHVDDHIVVSTAPGVTDAQARRAVERVLADVPTADLMSEEEFTASMAGEIDKVLNLVYVLLAMALVIALFGIANTLALSVLERSREIGVLRAVGMSRAQVRSTVRWESVLIALLGTSLGTAIGLGFAWAVARALEDTGFTTFAVPVGQLAVIVVVAALAAVAAASRPARRAARTDVLAAISGS